MRIIGLDHQIIARAPPEHVAIVSAAAVECVVVGAVAPVKPIVTRSTVDLVIVGQNTTIAATVATTIPITPEVTPAPCIVGVGTKKRVIAIAGINHVVAKAANDLVVAVLVRQEVIAIRAYDILRIRRDKVRTRHQFIRKPSRAIRELHLFDAATSTIQLAGQGNRSAINEGQGDVMVVARHRDLVGQNAAFQTQAVQVVRCRICIEHSIVAVSQLVEIRVVASPSLQRIVACVARQAVGRIGATNIVVSFATPKIETPRNQFFVGKCRPICKLE